jgi:hypothetical protein
MYKGLAYLPFLSAGEDPGPCSRPILFSKKKKKERKKKEIIEQNFILATTYSKK